MSGAFLLGGWEPCAPIGTEMEDGSFAHARMHGGCAATSGGSPMRDQLMPGIFTKDTPRMKMSQRPNTTAYAFTRSTPATTEMPITNTT